MTGFAMQRLLLCFVLLLGSAPLLAVQVADMYSASVPVADQSVAERQRATRQALAEVMVRLVGNRAILGDDRLVDTLKRADDYVLGYAYSDPGLPPGLDTPTGSEASDAGSEVPEHSLALRVSFEGNILQSVLRDLLLPVWPVDRPVLVVWLVQQGASGVQYYEATEQDGVVSVVEAALKRRGVPFKMPLYDLQDQMSLSADQALVGSVRELLVAGQRYGARHWLVLEVPTSSTQNRALTWQVGGEHENAAGKHSARLGISPVAGAVDAAIDRFSKAFVFQARHGERELDLVVGKVNSYGDFKALMDALDQLEVVTGVQVTQVEEGVLYLELRAAGDADVLLNTLDGHRNFERVMDIGAVGSSYRYQWRADYQ
ncbi:MAG TPA: hypothetical protein DCF62_02140 [Porticoccaceae bacterium]|nr:hypothetical protein [Porticoccaceae bacterium]